AYHDCIRDHCAQTLYPRGRAHGIAGCLVCDRNDERFSRAAINGTREMAFSGQIFGENDRARSEDPALAIAGYDFDRAFQIDEILTPRRVVPVDVIVSVCFPESERFDIYGIGNLSPLVDGLPVNLDIADMRLAFFVGVDVVNKHDVPS